VSITQLLSLPARRGPASGPVHEPAAVLVSAMTDDVLLWHLDEDGWD
jgi:hypothetical protein